MIEWTNIVYRPDETWNITYLDDRKDLWCIKVWPHFPIENLDLSTICCLYGRRYSSDIMSSSMGSCVYLASVQNITPEIFVHAVIPFCWYRSCKKNKSYAFTNCLYTCICYNHIQIFRYIKDSPVSKTWSGAKIN